MGTLDDGDGEPEDWKTVNDANAISSTVGTGTQVTCNNGGIPGNEAACFKVRFGEMNLQLRSQV